MAVDANPGAGEPAGIRSLARARSAKAAELQRVRTTVKSSAETITASTWTGKSRSAFTSAIDSALPDLALLAGGLEAQAETLHTYAAQVQQIKDEQAVLEAQRQAALESLARLKRQAPDAGGHLLAPVKIGGQGQGAGHSREQARLGEQIASENSRLAGIDALWNDLVARRRRFDQAAADALTSQKVLGGLWQFSRSTIRSTDTATLLGRMVGLTPTDIRILLDQRPELVVTIARAESASIAAWWASLGSANGEASAPQLTLISLIPVVIGALNGIPALARVAANKINAENRLKVLDALIEEHKRLPATIERLRKEVDYLTRAVGDHPAVQLYLYDPAKSRIIEMFGTPSPATRHEITYVPGTFSNIDGFYDGKAQAVARYLWSAHQGDSVAFVYKDGPFPGEADGTSFTSYLRIPEANEPGLARNSGTQLSAFRAGVELDPFLSKAKTTAIGHSWGLAAVTSSEVAGARYDQVISLSGAGMLPEWRPRATTSYSDLSYFDLLQQAQALPGDVVWNGKNPRSTPAFEHGDFYNGPVDHLVRAPNGALLRVDECVLMDNHDLIAKDSPDNQRLLKDLKGTIFR
ncbi:hypothetical protein [Leifsonia poae]|uniref:WXG100 family type VII secretion target n=1 Tax=Leifsonia poae TaxID=110933 RepID=UPI003D67198E